MGVGFFFSVATITFLFCEVGFGDVVLGVGRLVVLEVDGFVAGGLVGATVVLSGAVTVSVLVLVGGEARPR